MIELNELKDWFVDLTENLLTPLGNGQYEPISPDNVRAILALIDAEVERQSVTSDIGETSDGYHTFNELYEHRTALFATLCNMRSDISWKSMKHSDGSMFDGMFIAGIETPDGQYTYHCDMKYLYMFAYTPEIEKAPAYDGHQPSDYPRLLRLSKNSLYHRYKQSVTSEAMSVVRAEWKKDSDYPWLLNCSVCGYSTERGTNYCPNCGQAIDWEG